MNLTWAGALSGLGEGMQRFGAMWLAQQAQEMTALRQQRLAELQHGYRVREIDHRDALENKSRREIGGAVSEWARGGLADDSGMPRQPTNREMAERGMSEAMKRGEFGMAREISGLATPRTHVLAPGSTLVDESGTAIADNLEGLETRHRLASELEEQKAQLRQHYSLDAPQTTALERNLRFLVDNDIATDYREAFEKLRTGSVSNPANAMQSMATMLMRSGDRRYTGADGRERAISDARGLVGRIRQTENAEFRAGFNGQGGGAMDMHGAAVSPGASATVFDASNKAAFESGFTGEPIAPRAQQHLFNSADEVRAAYRAKRVDRETALRELRRFGFE